MSNKTHLDFLCDVGELILALTDSRNPEDFLKELVSAVARQLNADVSSIYLYNHSEHKLVLRATVGLNPTAVGTVSLAEGEGIVGTALKELRTIVDNDAINNKHYKPVPNIGEDSYQAFLAVPLMRGIERIGVITAQREQKHPFTSDDVAMLKAVAGQLAGTIENTRTIMVLESEDQISQHEKLTGTVYGRGMSSDWAYGRIQLFKQDKIQERKISPPPGLEDFHRALTQTTEQIQALQSSLTEQVPEAAALILDVHLLMLKDSGFIGKIESQINEGIPGDVAIRNVADEYASRFMQSENAYVREKEADIRDIERRLLANIDTNASQTVGDVASRIVVAHDLYPSDIVKLSAESVGGLVLTSGGATTHVSILARSLEIPMVVADEPQLLSLSKDTYLLADGGSGNVYIDPDDKILEQYRSADTARRVAQKKKIHKDTKTEDGTVIRLLANINLLTEVKTARELGAKGIGLYRTEFPFMIRTAFPTEEEQYRIYKLLAEDAPEGPLTFRTLDVGGEKALAYFDHGDERNPDLGLRSTRFTLKHPDILEQQCSAILRAGAERSDLRVMFPMISSVDEFRQVKEILSDVMRKLKEKGEQYHCSPKVGLMVELPSVLATIDAFVREADFLSIGTNDFVQYMLATDRGSDHVAEYYCPHHPAVLRGLSTVLRAAEKSGCEVSVCGEMAHQCKYLPFLIGIGCRTLSIDPHYIGTMQDCISDLKTDECSKHAESMLAADTIAEVEEVLKNME